MKRNYLALSGNKFDIEWYFSKTGDSYALEYYQNLDFTGKKKIWFLFQAMGNRGRIESKEKFRHEGDQIYAFKTGPDRFLCFFQKGSKIILTNAFTKKTDKIPKKEKERALGYRKDYLIRTEKGTYYEN